MAYEICCQVEVYRQFSDRSVHDQVSRSGWVSRLSATLTRFSTKEQNLAEFFAELRAEEAPISPLGSPLLH
jgi:hypothetical protein